MSQRRRRTRGREGRGGGGGRRVKGGRRGIFVGR